MHSPDRDTRRVWRRRRRLALLVGTASLLGLGGTLPARAQDARYQIDSYTALRLIDTYPELAFEKAWK